MRLYLQDGETLTQPVIIVLLLQSRISIRCCPIASS